MISTRPTVFWGKHTADGTQLLSSPHSFSPSLLSPSRAACSLPPSRMRVTEDGGTDPPAPSLPHACARRRTATQIRRLSPSLTHVRGGEWRHRSARSLPPSRMCVEADGDTDPPALSLVPHACARRRMATQIHRISSFVTHVNRGGRRHRSAGSLPPTRMRPRQIKSVGSLHHACTQRRTTT
jgi:hypothetical protein